jgi:hypothetical protein
VSVGGEEGVVGDLVEAMGGEGESVRMFGSERRICGNWGSW